MSWLIDEDSLDRFVSGDAGIRDVSLAGEPLDVTRANDDLLGGGDFAAATPPEFVRLYSSELLNASIIVDDNQDSIHSGVTILPSCSSSSVVSRYHPAHNTHNPNLIISEAVTDESAAVLSISPNSIDSSLLTEFSNCPMISSVVSDERSESPSETQTEMEVVSLDDSAASSYSFPDRKQETAVRVAVPNHYQQNRSEDDNINGTKWKLWYSRFETEKDWEEFQEKTNQLLEAVDCPMEDRDEMIAQLINMEEKLFWEHRSNSNDVVEARSKVSWILELAVLSASVAVAGVVIIRLLRGR